MSRTLHPSYPTLRERVPSNRLTFVLLPTLEMKTCVAETVRRQLSRSFATSRELKEHVIRTRFPICAGLPARKVETIRAVAAVVAEVLALISGVA